MKDKQETVYIGLGSNLGQREKTLKGAVQTLRNHDKIEVLAASDFIETKPVGGPPQGQYLNGAVKIRTCLSPEELLDVLQDIEHDFGRERKVRWGPRTLDLDILLYGKHKIHSPRLEIPHPRMHKRYFVLKPLTQIAPNIGHPVLEEKISRLLKKTDRR